MIRSRSSHMQRHLHLLSARVLPATLIALTATSCGPGVDPPDVRLNPSPQQRYEITLVIKDPPGEISSVKGSAQFDVKDKECMPMTDPIAGVWKHTSFSQPVTFHGDGNTHVGYVYADQVLDEDYFGLGKCEWSLTGVIGEFHVGRVERSISIRTKQILMEQKITGVCRSDSASIGICLTPPNAEKFHEPSYNFIASMQSRKISP